MAKPAPRSKSVSRPGNDSSPSTLERAEAHSRSVSEEPRTSVEESVPTTPTSTTRDREASRALTGEQAATAVALTGPPSDNTDTAFWLRTEETEEETSEETTESTDESKAAQADALTEGLSDPLTEADIERLEETVPNLLAGTGLHADIEPPADTFRALADGVGGSEGAAETIARIVLEQRPTGNSAPAGDGSYGYVVFEDAAVAGLTAAAAAGHNELAEALERASEEEFPEFSQALHEGGVVGRRIADTENPEFAAQTLGEHLEGTENNRIRAYLTEAFAEPIVARLSGADEEQIAGALKHLSRVAGDDEVGSLPLAQALAQNLPEDREILFQGLAQGAIGGNEALSTLLATELEAEEPELAAQVRDFAAFGAQIESAENPVELTDDLVSGLRRLGSEESQAAVIDWATNFILEAPAEGDRPAPVEAIRRLSGDLQYSSTLRDRVAEGLAENLPQDSETLLRGLAEASVTGSERLAATVATRIEADTPGLAVRLQSISTLGEQISQLESVEERKEFLDNLDGPNAELLEEASWSTYFRSLGEEDPEVVSAQLEELSELAQDDPAFARETARRLTENPPQDLPSVLTGLAEASLNGDSRLGEAWADRLDSEDVPIHSQIRAASELGEAARDIEQLVEVYPEVESPEELYELQSRGELPALDSALAAVDRLTTSLDGAPPELAQALLKQLDEDGSVARIVPFLGPHALQGHAFPATRFGDENYAQPSEYPVDGLPGEQVSRILTGLSEATSLAGDPALTERYGAVVADAITDSGTANLLGAHFEVAIENGSGAGLAGSVAQHLHETGEVDASARIVESIERGADRFLSRIDETADRIDTANADLSYIIANWGHGFGDPETDPAAQEALNAAIQEFRDNHPEYEQLNQLTRFAGDNLEVYHELQELFPDKGIIRDNERELLKELPRLSYTENGQRALAEAVERSGAGEQTFLDRLMEPEFTESLDDDFWEDNGLESYQEFKDLVGDRAVNASLAAYTEAASQGDDESMEMLGKGLEEQHDLLGEDRSTLRDIMNEYHAIVDESQNLVGLGADVFSGQRVQEHLDRLERLGSRLSNNRLQVSIKSVGPLLSSATVGLGWFQSLEDGLQAEEVLRNSVPTIKSALDTAEVIQLHRGGSVSNFVDGAGKLFSYVGIGLDAVNLVSSLEDGDFAAAGINGLGLISGIATAAGSSGVGLAVAGVALATQVGYGQFQKVQASNRFESDDARNFIGAILEHNGFPSAQVDDAVQQLINADSEGRQTGILLQLAAEQGGLDPVEFLLHIASQDSDELKKIITTGHGLDPEGESLTDIPLADEELDSLVGEDRIGRRGHAIGVHGPETVTGFLIWLAQRGILEQNGEGEFSLS